MKPCCPDVKKILMPTDLSEQARGAVKYAASLAETTQAELHILHVFTAHNYDPGLARKVMDGLKQALAHMEEQLRKKMQEEAEEHAKKHKITVKTAVVRSMAPYDAILGYARENDIDRIIMGTRGRTGLNYVLLGSVTEKVVEYSPCPVLVVNGVEREFVDRSGNMLLNRILYPTDFSEESTWAATRALELAEASSSEILVVHVVAPGEVTSAQRTRNASEEEAQKLLAAEALEALEKEAKRLFGGYDKVRCLVHAGAVPQTLADLAKEELVDLVTISSKGADSLREQLMGSVAERLLRLCPCPVLVTKQPPKKAIS